MSTEALAYLYESALMITSNTKQAGNAQHAHMAGRLHCGQTSAVDRGYSGGASVFEPACGHAAFLISAMRFLTELLPAISQEYRRDYLRKRLHGLEIDPFALEIARLRLTLADVPNPNGWALTEGDMFAGDRFEQGVNNATIVLGNPPFEKFKRKDARQGWLSNKATEAFRRVVEHLPRGRCSVSFSPKASCEANKEAECERRS